MSTAAALDYRDELVADLVNGYNISAPQAAWLLDVNHQCIWRYATNRWGRLVGSGHRLRLDLTDVMVLAALIYINGHGRGSWMPIKAHLADLAEDTIRRDPRPWLLFWPEGAVTVDDAEDCAEAIIARRLTTATAIDLWGWM